MQWVGKDLGCEVSTDRNYGGAVHDRYDSNNCRVNILHMPNWKNGDSVQLGVLVHESTHVVQNLMAHINEKHPSDEFQAFMIQGVFNIAHTHLKLRQTKRSKKMIPITTYQSMNTKQREDILNVLREQFADASGETLASFLTIENALLAIE